jgi:ketosteroid isomerase-like protein
MDATQIQEFFRSTDAGEQDELRNYLHADVRVAMIGVEGVDEPFDLGGYLRFLAASIAHRKSRGERTEHLPTRIKIDGDLIAIRGHLKITAPSQADEYHPYMDILKLRDGKIAEYNIAYDI